MQHNRMFMFSGKVTSKDDKFPGSIEDTSFPKGVTKSVPDTVLYDSAFLETKLLNPFMYGVELTPKRIDTNCPACVANSHWNITLSAPHTSIFCTPDMLMHTCKK